MAMQAATAYGEAMMRALPLLLIAGLAVPAMAQGPIGTIERGTYLCELPGDAGGRAGIPQPDREFTIISASRYSAPQGKGTYLRRGDTLLLSTGPRQGESYAVVGTGFLRQIEDGKPGRLRCIRSGR